MCYKRQKGHTLIQVATSSYWTVGSRTNLGTSTDHPILLRGYASTLSTILWVRLCLNQLTGHHTITPNSACPDSMTQDKPIITAVDSLSHTGWSQSPRLKWSSSWSLRNSWDHEFMPLHLSRQPAVNKRLSSCPECNPKDLLHLILLAIPWHACCIISILRGYDRGTENP